MGKILILSTGDVHGAYEIAYNIAQFLYEANHTVALVVQHKTKNAPFVMQVSEPSVLIPLRKRIVNKILHKARLLPTSKERIDSFATNNKYLFLTPNENAKSISAATILNSISFVPDLIIAGMTDGFCTSNTLSELYVATKAKIYTWSVDMGPLTGGCHYAWDCKGYEKECKNCPAIIEESKKDKAHMNFTIKQDNIIKSGIKVLSGSQWTTEQAENSTLYKIQKKILTTNACIDTRILNGKNRSIAKQVFGIPQDAKIIFTGSWNVNDPRKGMPYFLEALTNLWNFMDPALKEKTYILIAGEHYGSMDFLSTIPFKKRHIDYIKDYRLLSLLYQAADVFVCASIEDSGPMMVSEAMACGTPVVGFRMGSVYSMVENDNNGYVAELENSKDLAMGIDKILSLSTEEFARYSKNAITKIEMVASHQVAVNVIESLFEDN